MNNASVIPERRLVLPRGGTLILHAIPTHLPFGARGVRPVSFAGVAKDKIKNLKWLGVPGLCFDGASTVSCTYDAAPIVARELGEEPSIVPIPWNAEIPLPGLEEYNDLGLHNIMRPYQKEDALFLARRAYGWNAESMGSGKLLATAAAALLIGARKILVIPPAFVTREWGKQLAQYCKTEALILHGRACREARRLCVTCLGRGYLQKKGEFETTPCASCPRRTPGQRLLQVNDLRPVYEEHVTGEGYSFSPYPASTYSCPKHRLIIEAKSGLCPACKDDLHDAIQLARWVVVNPELLMAHKTTDDWGGVYYRQDLAGWANELARHKFDIAIIDESHIFRGFPLGSIDAKSGKGETRRDRLKEVVRHIERVWMVTGTPMFGFTRDYWSQLDIMSGGLWSADWCDSLPFSYAKAYCCGGKQGEYGGYNWDGRSARAATELEPRLAVLKIARPRSVILPYMPRKMRQVIEIDAANAEAKPIRLSKKDKKDGTTRESALVKMLARAADVTRPVMIEKVMGEICDGTGNKVIVFARLHDSVDRLAKAFDKTLGSREYSKRCTQLNAALWACHGGQDKNIRLRSGEAFQEHAGAGIFIASIDSFQVGVRLHSKADDHPVTSVHFSEFHHSPMAMLQAEDRPYVPGVNGLNIVYYIARGTIHDRIMKQLIPRIETADELAHDEGAKEMFSAMVGREKETLDEILNRLTEDTEHLVGLFGDDNEGSGDDDDGDWDD